MRFVVRSNRATLHLQLEGQHIHSVVRRLAQAEYPISGLLFGAN
ncbi:hypothetical protein JOH52_006882 [Sinorhizobium meliloti]|nr:hypothetical protein [Sinorhizobium meliloti]